MTYIHTQSDSTSLFFHSLPERGSQSSHLTPPTQGEGLGPVALCLLPEPKTQFLRSACKFMLPLWRVLVVGSVCPSSRISHFSKCPQFYLLETKIWVLVVLIATWMSLFLGHNAIIDMSMHVSMIAYIYTHIYLFVYVFASILS